MARAHTPLPLDALRGCVNGACVATAEPFDTIRPLDRRVPARVHEADAALTDRANEMLRRASDGGAGLAATVRAARPSRAHRVAPWLKVGIVRANAWFAPTCARRLTAVACRASGARAGAGRSTLSVSAPISASRSET